MGVLLKADYQRLVSMLGQSMYAGNPINIAVKELLQNSFDAVKSELRHGLDKGLIEFRLDRESRKLSVKDNGCGMSPDVVANKFLSIGGTYKDLETDDRSGGLGVAKVQFFATTTRIKVHTVRDNIATDVDTTAEALFTGENKFESCPTKEPNGTTITFYYPEKVSMPLGLPSVLNKPLLSNLPIEVTWNGHHVCSIPSQFNSHMDFDFSWAKVRVYLKSDLNADLSWTKQQQVFSAGLYQFDHYFQTSNNSSLKLEALINIMPKVPAEDLNYPFNLQRQGFKPQPQVKKDLEVIGNYLHDLEFLITQERIRKEFASLQSLEYCDLEATSAPEQILDRKCKIAFSEEFAKKFVIFLSQCGSSMYQEPEIIKATRIQMSSAQRQEELSNSLKYCNNTTECYSDYRLLFCKVASAIRDGFDLLPGRYKDHSNFPSLAEILIDKKRQGCLISGNFNLLCINPLSCKHPSSQETWVAYMMSVFMHEATHILQSYHDDEFCVEQNSLLQDLIADDVYNQLAGKFRTIWLQHNLDIVNASNLFEHSVNKI